MGSAAAEEGRQDELGVEPGAGLEELEGMRGGDTHGRFFSSFMASLQS